MTAKRLQMKWQCPGHPSDSEHSMPMKGIYTFFELDRHEELIPSASSWMRSVFPTSAATVYSGETQPSKSKSGLRLINGHKGMLHLQRDESLRDEKVTILLAGDNLSRGAISRKYLNVIEQCFPHFRFLNAGIDGDTAATLLKRLDRLLLSEPQGITLLIGSNDIWEGDTLRQYHSNLLAILRKLERSRVAIVSIPPVADNCFNAMNRRIIKCNQVIQELAADYSIAYLPLFEKLASQLTKVGEPNKLSMSLVAAALFRNRILGRSYDEMREDSGSSTLPELKHLSDRGAVILAELISGWLNANFCSTQIDLAP